MLNIKYFVVRHDKATLCSVFLILLAIYNLLNVATIGSEHGSLMQSNKRWDRFVLHRDFEI